MNRRAGRSLPASAWRRESFELQDIGAQRTAAVALDEPKYWAARLDDADKSVPLRTWVTEIGVGADSSGHTLFGVRLICTTRGADQPFDRTVPGFVKAILASGPAALDGRAVEKNVRIVSSEDDVFDLVALLESPDRQGDVIVFALPEGSSNPSEAAASFKEVHSRLLGISHVYVLTSQASFGLTNRVGRELSVFRQAVRTYRPGFRAWIDEPSNHPLALPHRIQDWNEEGPAAFERWLVSRALSGSVHGTQREARLPGFNEVRQLAAEAERARHRQAGGSDKELAELYERDNDQLRRELREQKEQYDGLLADADAEREAAVQSANAAKAQALDRLFRIRSLEKSLTEASRQEATPIPDLLDGFEGWCREHLIGKVELANRAYQGVRKSEFHDPSFLYKTLLLLRDYYVPMRLDASPGLRQAYGEALQNLKLEESPTGDGINYSADLYSVQYGGTRRSLDRHLKGSNSRDRRYGFRLYFFWDEEGEVVVVGWLPSHLDNRAS